MVPLSQCPTQPWVCLNPRVPAVLSSDTMNSLYSVLPGSSPFSCSNLPSSDSWKIPSLDSLSSHETYPGIVLAHGWYDSDISHQDTPPHPLHPILPTDSSLHRFHAQEALVYWVGWGLDSTESPEKLHNASSEGRKLLKSLQVFLHALLSPDHYEVMPLSTPQGWEVGILLLCVWNPKYNHIQAFTLDDNPLSWLGLFSSILPYEFIEKSCCGSSK